MHCSAVVTDTVRAAWEKNSQVPIGKLPGCGRGLRLLLGPGLGLGLLRRAAPLALDTPTCPAEEHRWKEVPFSSIFALEELVSSCHPSPLPPQSRIHWARNGFEAPQ